MGYEKRNRGPQPEDEKCFGLPIQPVLGFAVDDYGYLQSRGYGHRSTTKIVGDRYGLNTRQRTALQRIGAGDHEIKRRLMTEVSLSQLRERIVAIDGFNLLITLESALSGGYIFKARDGAYRDMASISGSYKRVNQTKFAIELVVESLQEVQAEQIRWYLDAPISNSGRLASLIREVGEARHINWTVELVADPDRTIIDIPNVVAISSDSWVMDDSANWCNLFASILPELADIRLIVV